MHLFWNSCRTLFTALEIRWSMCASVLHRFHPVWSYSANKIADPAPARELEGFIFARFLSCYSLESQPDPIFLHYIWIMRHKLESIMSSYVFSRDSNSLFHTSHKRNFPTKFKSVNIIRKDFSPFNKQKILFGTKPRGP